MSTTASPTITLASQLQRGPANLWVNLAKPVSPAHIITLDTASGTPDHTTNANAQHMGLLAVPSILTYTPKPDFEVVDQDTAPVAAFANTEEAVIECEMSQLNFAKVMKYCMPSQVFGDGIAQDGVTLGLGGDILMAPTCMAVIAPCSDGVFKWVIGLLYNAVPASAVKLTLGRSKTATYQVQFKGLSDLTRPAGDRIGSIYKTT